jgi:hypothetical protein
MVLVRVHAAIGKQAEQVQTALASAGGYIASSSVGFVKNSPFSIMRSILGDVHVDHSPGADVEMSDLAVAHLPGRQPDVAAAGVEERVGIFGEQAIVIGFARQRDGVGLDGGA